MVMVSKQARSKPTTKRPARRLAAHSRLRAGARRHYLRIMPDRFRSRAAIWTVFWIISAIILLQLMYPPTRAVPSAILSGQPVGWREEAQLAARISQLFADSSVDLQLADGSLKVPLSQLGAEPETAAMIGRLTDYPFWQRYLPLSAFWQPAQLQTATVTYTGTIAERQCRLLAERLSHPAIDARLELTAGQLIAADDQLGRKVDADKLCHAIQSADIRLGSTTSVDVEVESVVARRTAADFATVRGQAERALGRDIVLQQGDRQYRPDRATVASWLQLSQAAGGRTGLAVDRQRVRSYLEDLNKSIGRPAGTTHVKLVNGSEVSRQLGSKGLQIDYRPVIDAIEQHLLSAVMSRAIELTLSEVAPAVVYNNRYTATEAGLQAYVDDAARDYNAHIMLRQLTGEGWQAAARQHESIPSASTYKVYVAAWLFDQMAKGKIRWDTPILDTDTSTCFDRMTIASTNPCPRQWLDQAGRDNMNRYIWSLGASQGTTFTSPIAVHTTAADLTNHMTELAQGNLYADIYRQRLYKSLSSHPYRYGIPAGSSASLVYDKVGFLWDYIHDTAIVKHPRGTYVLTIMTKGQSYARIAQITREIERIMYE